MSFYDDASLVFLPSGEAGKDGKAYSMKPTNGDGDFTFNRGSNLTATRVDSNGLIEKGRENLLLQSNQFDTTWVTSNTSVTSGQSGYDGSSDAWLLSKSAASGRIYQNASVSGVATYSVYAKAGSTDWIYIIGSAGIYPEAYFDLSNGVVGNTSSNPNFIGANIQDVGNGWYRCSITFNTSLTRLWIYPADGNGDTSGTSGSIYIQDAQVEIGLVATEYIESGATTGLAGLLEDSPRFDYSGGASCPSLLLEPSRTNLIDYSEAIEFGISTNECTQTITNQTNPSGNNVSYLASAIDSVNDQMRYDKNGLSSGSYFLSAFVKGDGNTNRIRMRGTGGGVTIGNVYWDVAADGTTTLNTSLSPSGVNAITEDYGDGWYRIGFEETFDGSSTSRFAIYPSNGDVNASTYIWGVQWEQGSYPTSYIPNHSGGSVTRAAETARGLFNGDSIFDRDWTAFCELVVPNVGGDLTGAGFVLKSVEGSTSTADRVAVLVHESNSQLELIFYDGTSQQQIPFNYTFGDTLKIAIRNDSAYFINGTKYTTTKVLQEPVEIAYGRAGQADSSVGETANIKQTLVFPTALSDANCITLTS